MSELLDRLEDSTTGEVKLGEMTVTIRAERRAEAEAAAASDPGAAQRPYPLVEGIQTVSNGDAELVLNNTWRPTLSVIGAAWLSRISAALAALVARASTVELSLSCCGGQPGGGGASVDVVFDCPEGGTKWGRCLGLPGGE